MNENELIFTMDDDKIKISNNNNLNNNNLKIKFDLYSKKISKVKNTIILSKSPSLSDMCNIPIPPPHMRKNNMWRLLLKLNKL